MLFIQSRLNDPFLKCRFYIHEPGDEIWLMLDVPPLPMKSNIFQVDPDNIATDLRITKTEDIVHPGKFAWLAKVKETSTD